LTIEKVNERVRTMAKHLFFMGFMLFVLAVALFGCSMADPLTGGAVVQIPEGNSTLSAAEPSVIESASVSARVFVRPLPSQ
jgi:hypothetical protein